MKRLTYIHKDGEYDYSGKACLRDVINRLAEYENMEEQGLLVRLPVKIGTPIFFIKHDGYLECNKLQNCPPKEKLNCNLNCFENMYKVVQEDFELEHLDKTIFLTEAEALQALKERE